MCFNSFQASNLDNVVVRHDKEYRDTSFCDALFSCATDVFFYNLEGVCGNPVLSKSISTIFPTAIVCFFLSVKFWLLLQCFKIFIVIIFDLVICNQGSLLLLL